MVGDDRGVGEDMGAHAYVAVELGTSGEPSAAHHLAAVQAVADTGADLVFWADSFVPPEQAEPPTLDAVAIAARVAPVVAGIGLVPTVTVTHTEPFHVSKAIATLDLVSQGRAGWQVAVSRTEEEALLFGRKPAAPPALLWQEAAEAVEVVVRLWDSWEDDAVIRDLPTGRYVDRDRLHYIDFVGEFFSVKGPSITPRSPQAHPLVVVRDEPDALPVVAALGRRRARRRAGPRRRAHGAGAGPRGGHGRRAATPTRSPCSSTSPARRAATSRRGRARRRGRRRHAARRPRPRTSSHGSTELGLRRPVAGSATLRERFGLPRPANYFAGAHR